MPVYETDLRRLGALVLSHERKRQGEVSSAVRVAAKMGAKIIRQNAPKATLRLSDSVEVEEHADGNAEVVIRAPHAVAVEVGSRPHTPPIAPLIEWAQAIGAANPRAVAGAVFTHIKFEGTRPHWFVRGSIPAIMQATGARIRYVLKK
jgi:hypothetical protein